MDTNIPMELTYTNTGNGWNDVANVFLAPVSGTYQFTASLHATSDANAFCHIVHTTSVGQTKAAALFAYNGQSDANSVILEMEAGDYGTFQLEAGSGRIYSSAERVYTTFSGFLLFT